jgi:citrate synthase
MGTIVAGLEGVVAGESEICYIDGYAGILSYRGYNIHTLADNATFEEVIFLLWNGWLPKQAELDQLKKDLAANRGIPTAVVDFLKSVPQASPMDVLRTAVSMLGIYDPETPDMTPEANARKALRLMAQTATIVTTFDRLRKGLHVIGGDPAMSFAENFLYTLTGKRPDDVMEHAFDVALILHADHELNASTFAARVTAATLSDIYSSITSAIGALKGPLHGGANQDVIKILLQLERGSRHRLGEEHAGAQGEDPGFGHRVYRTEDPRATHLRVFSEELGKRTGHEKLFRLSQAMEQTVKAEKG